MEIKYKKGYKIIYKITYPNKKIYIGSDFTDNFNYFGSVNEKFLRDDFSRDEIQKFKITKDIIFEEIDIDYFVLLIKEKEFIIKYESNNPLIGYNKKPKYKNK
ncbi:hypothetical protein AXG55_10730 [Silvanigrella aquatica]|uniref:GIY-YIG domain-containing protein n=1 Tax=Silvanigrella aquatica TaxID=1915309 RepID=A0A1L4D4Q6_9BACT|nr:hypothetical protein AXG55_10730 [Silvanigrella aquatica]